MRILSWIFRILLILLVLRLVVRAVSGFMRPSRSGAGRAPGRMRERAGGELVRDPNCGTFIPRNTAIAVGSGADTKYFCSDTCRDQFLART